MFASRIRSLVESSAMPRLSAAFGVSSEEEAFLALLVMLGQHVAVRPLETAAR